MSIQPDTPAPQWAVEAAKEISTHHWKTGAMIVPEYATIIARHAPQPTALTAQPEQPAATPAIESHICDGKQSSLSTGRLAPGERAYAGKPAATGTPDVGATPRTDALIFAPNGNYFSASASNYRDLCRQLERELAEARAEHRANVDLLLIERDATIEELRRELETLKRDDIEHLHQFPVQLSREAYLADRQALESCRAELTALRGLLERGAKMRPILRGLLASAKAEAGDVLTDPTWNHDYLFGFKLTVKDLRAIDRYLATERKEDGKS